MRVSKIQIKDFKRFHDLTIDLGKDPKKIIALIGPNGCGKSSVLDAFVSKVITASSSRVSKGYIPQHFWRNKDNRWDSIKVLDKDENEIIHKNNEISIRSPYRYNTSLDVKEIKAVKRIQENEDGEISTIHIDDRIENNYRLLLAQYRDYLEEKNVKPSEAKEYIMGDLNDSIKRCLDLEIVNLGNVEKGEGSIFFKKSDSDLKFSFNHLSSGEKEVVDIILDLYLRKSEYKGMIYLIDEPELHINTAIQRKLLHEINNLIDDEGQIWIATHSIGFMRAIQSDFADISQVIQFDDKTKYASEPVTLEAIKPNRKNWQAIFATALDDLTGLIAPRRIIYCEGKANKRPQEQGMDAQVLNNIFGQTYPDTVFVSSGGNTELDQRSEIALAILGKVFPDLEIWVFKDRDMASGKTTTEQDRQEYLKINPDNHRVMKRWEIENYLFDKEVLIAYCQNKGRYLDESTYDIRISNIYDEDVKSLVGYIKNLCQISCSINPDKFKIELSKYITPNMEVYKELEKCIFNRE